MADEPDALETKIRAILDQYKTITSELASGAGGEELEYVEGRLKRNEHSAPPQVSWVETGGDFEAGRGADGAVQPEALSMWCDLDVEVWRTTVKECRDTCFNLIAAARRAIDAADLRWSRYTRVQEEHIDHGFIFKLDMQIRVPSPLSGTRGRLRVILRHHTGTHTSENETNVDVHGDAPEEP